MPENKNAALSLFLDACEIFAFAVLTVFLIFTFVCRPCRVDGSSMNQTLEDKQILLASSFAYSPKQGDIVIFQLNNPNQNNQDQDLGKVLVKRVIALGGQTVKINFNTNEITVDGVVFDDPNAYFAGAKLTAEYDFDRTTGIFETQVPEGSVFVLGDNRNNSRDSRSVSVGCVSLERILGRVFLRVNPLTVY